MEITKENVPTLLVQHGVIPQALVDQSEGDEDFLNAMSTIAELTVIGEKLLDTDDPKDLVAFAVRIYVMGSKEGTAMCRMAALIRDIGGTPEDVAALVDKAARKASVVRLAEMAIAKASAH